MVELPLISFWLPISNKRRGEFFNPGTRCGRVPKGSPLQKTQKTARARFRSRLPAARSRRSRHPSHPGPGPNRRGTSSQPPHSWPLGRFEAIILAKTLPKTRNSGARIGLLGVSRLFACCQGKLKGKPPFCGVRSHVLTSRVQDTHGRGGGGGRGLSPMFGHRHGLFCNKV